MIIKKFGMIWQDDDGYIQVHGFKFEGESAREAEESGKEENIIPCIIRYIANTCKAPAIDPPFDMKSEMAVLNAIQRARCS